MYIACSVMTPPLTYLWHNWSHWSIYDPTDTTDHTFIRNGVAIHNALFGMTSVPVAFLWNFMMIMPATKYATMATSKLLCEEQCTETVIIVLTDIII